MQKVENIVVGVMCILFMNRLYVFAVSHLSHQLVNKINKS